MRKYIIGGAIVVAVVVVIICGYYFGYNTKFSVTTVDTKIEYETTK